MAKKLPIQRKKCIIKPKGDFTYLNSNGDAIHHNRPTLTTMTPFVEMLVQSGDVKMYASNIPAQATDDEFIQFFKDSKKKIALAVSSYCSTFGLDTFGDPLEEQFKDTNPSVGDVAQDEMDLDNDEDNTINDLEPRD